VIDAAEPLLDVEEQRTLSDGTPATLLTSRVPLRDPAGRVDRVARRVPRT
jgi:hypothetical protein